MLFKPQKKVGSPASVKGVRGDYLTTLIMFLGGGLFFILIILMIPLPFLIQLLFVLFTIVFLGYKYNTLKKMSKGDMYQETKKNSRKKVQIISKPLKKV